MLTVHQSKTEFILKYIEFLNSFGASFPDYATEVLEQHDTVTQYCHNIIVSGSRANC